MLDVPYRGCVLHFWDLGGAVAMRPLWEEYAPDAHVLVWTIDAPRWLEDAAGDDGAYRAAVCAALFPLAQGAAERAQPLVVLATQMDAVGAASKASASGVLAGIADTITTRWASYIDTVPGGATYNLAWSFLGSSAALAHDPGIEAALDAIHTAALASGRPALTAERL